MPQIHQASPIFFNGPSCCLLQIVRVLSRSSFHSPLSLPPRQPTFQPRFTSFVSDICTIRHRKGGQVAQWPQNLFHFVGCAPTTPPPYPHKKKSSRMRRPQIWSAYFSQLHCSEELKTIIACFKMFVCLLSFHRRFPWFMANILLQGSHSFRKKKTTTQTNKPTKTPTKQQKKKPTKQKNPNKKPT